jgi:hypothetical protein
MARHYHHAAYRGALLSAGFKPITEWEIDGSNTSGIGRTEVLHDRVSTHPYVHNEMLYQFVILQSF